MKKIVLLASIFILVNTSYSQNYDWGVTLNDSLYSAGRKTVIDSKGSVYMHGEHRSTLDADPGLGVFNLTSLFSSNTGYLVKLDSNGNFLWGKKFSNSSFSYGEIAVDNNDNIILYSEFWDSVDVNPGDTPQIEYGSTPGTTDSYFVKFDALGNYLWSSSITSKKNINSISISVDGNNDIYLTGNQYDSIFLSPNTYNKAIAPIGLRNQFLIKLNSAGNYLWHKNIVKGNIANIQFNNNFIYHTGNFIDSLIIQSNTNLDTVIGKGGFDFYIEKLDLSGNRIWLKTIGGPSRDVINNNALGFDSNNELFVVGQFEDSVDFGDGNYLKSPNGGRLPFLMNLSDNGILNWVIPYQTEGSTLRYLFVDPQDNLHIGGVLVDTADLDPGIGVANLFPSPGSSRIGFISILDNHGGFISAHKIQGVSEVYANDMDAKNGNFIVIGSILDTANLHPFGGSDIETTGGGYDAYCIKYTASQITGLFEIKDNKQLIVFPNPTTSSISVNGFNTNEPVKVSILNTSGQIIFQTKDILNIDVSNLSRGTYILSVESKSDYYISKFVKN